MIEAKKNGFTGNVISVEEHVIYKNMINLRQLVQIYILPVLDMQQNNQELVVNKNKLVSIIIYWDINKYI